jgi:parallel beta-helix repeat protein
MYRNGSASSPELPRCRMLRTRPWIRWSAALLLMGLGTARAAVYYVLPDGGSDAQNGLYPNPGPSGGPFQTLHHAVSVADDGDTIHLRGGVYAESVYIAKGTESAPLVLAAYETEAPVFTHDTEVHALYVESAGFELRGLAFTTRGVTVANSRNLLVQDCRFEGITESAALYIGASREVVVRGNRFENNRHVTTLIAQNGTGAIEIRNNVFVNNAPAAPGELRVINISSCAAGVIVANNDLRNTQDKAAFPEIPMGSPAAAIQVFRSPGVVIRENTIEDFRFAGTVDDTAFDPAYLKTPAQGGENGDGINVVGTRPVVVESVQILANTISNVSGRGIVCAYVKDSRITGNQVTAAGRHGIFVIGLPADRSQVVNNVFEDNVVQGTGWLHGGCSGLSVIVGGPGHIFRRNVSVGNRQGTAGEVGADWFLDGHGLIADLQSHGTVFENNLAIGNEGVGIALNQANDCILLNNTIVGNGHCPHTEDLGGVSMFGAARATIVNNLFHNNRNTPVVEYETGKGHVIHHNLYSHGPLTLPEAVNSVVVWDHARYTLPEWKTLMQGTGNGEGSVYGAPVFEGDPATAAPEAFRLVRGPGIRAGTALSTFAVVLGYTVTWDFGNLTRHAAEPTMGAWETDVVAQAQQAFGGSVVLADDWIWTNWMGYLNVKWFPWVWHRELGFLYCLGDSTTGLWMYAWDLRGWLWTTRSFYPAMYSSLDQSWLWYRRGSRNPKAFYHFTQDRWIYR